MAEGGAAENVGDRLAAIRAEVESGNTDLKALGFWKLVGRIKRDPALIEAHADEVGEIDRLAFERRFRFRPPVWLGNLVLIVGAGLAKLAVWVAYDLAAEAPRGGWVISTPGRTEILQLVEGSVASGILLLGAAGVLSVTSHDVMHWVAGRLGGIRFSSYFLDGPFRIQPGIKTDYASYLRASPTARAWMHASGALVSKVAPFAVFAFAYAAHAARGYELFPEWALWGLLGLGVLQILTDVVWSTKRSDWKKFRRERRIASDLYSKG